MTFATMPAQYASPFERSPRATQGAGKLTSLAYAAPHFGPLRKPTEVLMDNSNDRPDVATIAILGYN